MKCVWISRGSFLASLILVSVVLGSCEGEVLPPAVDASVNDCDSPVSLRPRDAVLAPDQVLVLTAAGGSGDYSFSVATNESGSRISATTGTYLAGLTPGTDEVVVRDETCGTEARSQIRVTPPFVLEPQSLRVEPGDTLTLITSGGSGEASFELVSSRSGASVSPTGQYTAGMELGVDLVRATDTLTQAVSQSMITVVLDASLELPVRRVFIPVGSHYDFQLDGMGGMELSSLSPETVTVENLRLRGVAAGEAEIVATEAFSGRTASVRVTVIASRSVAGDRTDEFSDGATFGQAADFTGDGLTDVLFASPLASSGGYLTGSLFLYEGNGSGLDNSPSRTWSGETRDERFGSALATVDLDGDGVLEVLVGSPRADILGTNNGAVFFYRIGDDGQLEDTPYHYIFGTGAFDSFGQSIVACDFNADGEMDIAVGSITDETGSYSPLGRDQGAVHVFLGRGAGEIRVTMDVSVYGEVASEPDAEGEREWLAVPGMNLGRELTAGDFDGDGACDLAANARRPNATGQDAGFVAIFRGVAATDTDRGGVEEHAGLRISGLLDGVTNGQLGRFIRMADLDDDGKDDLILAHYNAPVLGENSTGMVYVIPGQRLSAEPAYEDVLPVDMASSTLLGPGTSAEFGRGLDVGDTNGDGRLDIIVGAPRAGEPESGINRAGGVFVYQQGDLGVPPEPSSTIWGIERDQRFGHAVRAIGSLGIGRGTSVMALSGYTYTQGVRIPAPRRLNLMTSEPGEEMSTPGVGAGAEFGRAVLFPGDINGDGFPDLVLGAHREARIRWNGRRGAAHIYLGTAEGLPSEPSMQLADFPHHGGDFSIRMMPAGDFNGDGNPDYAVLASGANRPNITDTENFLVADDCSSNPGRGVVHIFLGTASGSPAERPAFMLVGPETGRGRISHILGGVDTDGDDLDDVIVSSQDWRNTPTPTDPPPDEPVMQYGGFAVYRGNLPDPSGRIVVLCEPNHIEFGPDRDTDFGGALAPIGDLDGDGCEDFAVGDSGHDIPLAEDAFITNVGSVSVFFGFDGPTCLESSPRSTRFVGRAQFGSAGSRLAGGADLDGDGLNELLVGSFAFRDSEGQRGRVYLMRGDYIRSVAMSGTSDAPIVDPTSSQRLMLAGQEPGADFGLGLALLPNLGVEAGPGIAVGARRSGLGAAPLSGGVYIHRYTEAGLDQAHAAVIAGDESATESLLGEWIATSPTTPPMLGVSARMSSASYAGVGSAYVFPLTP